MTTNILSLKKDINIFHKVLEYFKTHKYRKLGPKIRFHLGLSVLTPSNVENNERDAKLPHITVSITSVLFAAIFVSLAWSTNSQAREVRWGEYGDIPVPVDFDGDDKADIAIWRPSTGTWWIIESATNTTRTVRWGESGDTPVATDYDGDNKADIAIWRPSTGTWWIVLSAATNNPVRTIRWGEPGDVPVAADYDGDNKADIGIWRPSTGDWWLVLSGANGAVRKQQWGTAGDVPIPGINSEYGWDDRPGADFTVWRPSTRTAYILSSFDGRTNTKRFDFNTSNEHTVPYNDCGGMTLAFWNSITGNWLVNPVAGSYYYTVQWGVFGDVPVPAEYAGHHKTQIAVFRPSEGRWYIREDILECLY
jgi:hypothetical protein